MGDQKLNEYQNTLLHVHLFVYVFIDINLGFSIRIRIRIWIQICSQNLNVVYFRMCNFQIGVIG